MVAPLKSAGGRQLARRSDTDLALELRHIVSLFQREPVGDTPESRDRISAALRETARRLTAEKAPRR